MKEKCARCGIFPQYQHPKTNEFYKLCAKYLPSTLVKLCNHVDNEEKTDEEQVDETLNYIPYKDWA